MTKKSDQDLAQEILELVGGKSNISEIVSCMTRLP